MYEVGTEIKGGHVQLLQWTWRARSSNMKRSPSFERSSRSPNHYKPSLMVKQTRFLPFWDIEVKINNKKSPRSPNAGIMPSQRVYVSRAFRATEQPLAFNSQPSPFFIGRAQPQCSPTTDVQVALQQRNCFNFFHWARTSKPRNKGRQGMHTPVCPSCTTTFSIQ